MIDVTAVSWQAPEHRADPHARGLSPSKKMHLYAQSRHATLPAARPINKQKRRDGHREGTMVNDRQGCGPNGLGGVAARLENTAPGQQALRETMTAKAAEV